MPGGSPQGTILLMFLFVILKNPIGFNPNKDIGKQMSHAIHKRVPMQNIHLEYIDDMTIAETIMLKDKLLVNIDLSHPRLYHERTGHILEPDDGQIQSKLLGIINI